MPIDIIGSPLADTLDGTSGNDNLQGLGGDDLLRGNGGTDTLHGGSGNDTLNAGGYLDGGDGDDRLDGAGSLLGGAGDDLLQTVSPSGNLLLGGAGNDTIRGYQDQYGWFSPGGGNTLDGGEGDDELASSHGTLIGGYGNDLFDLTLTSPPFQVRITVDGGPGEADRIKFNGKYLDYLTVTGVEFMTVPAVSLRTPGATAAGLDRLVFNNADIASFPTLTSGSPGWVMVEKGGDFSSLRLSGPIGIDNSGGSLVTGSTGDDVLAVEYAGTAYGGDGDDTFNGAAEVRSVSVRDGKGDLGYAYSYAGAETFFGGDGNDTFIIQPNHYRIIFDSYDGSSAPRIIDGGNGIDRLVTQNLFLDLTISQITNVDILQPRFGVGLIATQLDGFAALDLRPFDGSGPVVELPKPVSYSPAITYAQPAIGTMPVISAFGAGVFDFSRKQFLSGTTVQALGDGAGQTIKGAFGGDMLSGGGGDDLLFGNGGDDSLDGGTGDDRLYGGAGRDTLAGGAGDDVLSGGPGDNLIAGGAGWDTLYVDGGRRAAIITARVESTSVEGDSRISSLAGTATTSTQTTGFTGIETFSFAEGDLIFDTGSLAFATARLYLAALGRAPDPLGLADNVALLGKTLSFSQLSEFFAASPEFNLRYPAVDNAGFVNLMYQNTLGRAPDSQGFTFWTNILDQGLGTRGAILEGFANSAEFIARAQTLLPNGVWLPDADASAVARVYQATLGRHPDEAGLAYWRAQVEAGFSLRDLVPLFLNSPESQARYGTQDDAGFLTTLYRNVLERTPDAEGYAYWTGNLAAGMTRADVVMLFSQSPEFIAKTAPWIADGIDFAG